MARETKFGLLFVVVLASTFGLMVYKRLHQPLPLMAEAESELQDEQPDDSETNETLQVPVVDVAFEDEFGNKSNPPSSGNPPVPRPVSPLGRETNSGISQPTLSTPETQVAQTTATPPGLPTEIEDDFFAPPSQPVTPNSASEGLAKTADVSASTEPDPFGFAPPVERTRTDSSLPASKTPDAYDPFAAAPVVDASTETSARQVPLQSYAPIGEMTQEREASPILTEAAPSIETPAATSGPFPPADDPFATPAPSTNLQARSTNPTTTPAVNTEAEFDPFASAPAEAMTRQPAKTLPESPPANSETFDPFESPQTTTPLPTTADSDFPAPQPQPAPTFDLEETRPVPTTTVKAIGTPNNPTPVKDVPQPASEFRPEELGGFQPVVESDTATRNSANTEQPPTSPLPNDPFDDLPMAVPSVSVKSGIPNDDFSAPAPQVLPEASTRPSTAPSLTGENYVVQPSDSFWTISKRVYGTGRYFRALAKHNSALIGDPDKLQPGVKIATPPMQEMDRLYRAEIPLAASTAVQHVQLQNPERYQPEAEPGFFIHASGQPMYRVDSNDTLSDISQNHLGRSSRWIQIFEMNRDILKDGNTLSIGTVLKLPADASQVRVVGFESSNR